jgi:cell division protein FtsZ
LQATTAPTLQVMLQPEEAAAPAPVPTMTPSVPVAAQPIAAPQPPAAGGFGGLFRRVTGAASGGMMRRTLTEPAPAPVAPRLDQVAQPRQAEVPQGQVDFEIPTFLRRQSN